MARPGGVTATAKKGGDDVRVATHLVQPDNVDNGNALAADATKNVEQLPDQSAAVAAPIAPAAERSAKRLRP